MTKAQFIEASLKTLKDALINKRINATSCISCCNVDLNEHGTHQIIDIRFNMWEAEYCDDWGDGVYNTYSLEIKVERVSTSGTNRRTSKWIDFILY